MYDTITIFKNFFITFFTVKINIFTFCHCYSFIKYSLKLLFVD